LIFPFLKNKKVPEDFIHKQTTFSDALFSTTTRGRKTHTTLHAQSLIIVLSKRAYTPSLVLSRQQKQR